jgi:hypothetical protein
MRYYEVSGSWSMLIAVDVPETEEQDERAENAAWAYFRDQFDERQFLKDVETIEGRQGYSDEEFVNRIRPGGDDGYQWEWAGDE